MRPYRSISKRGGWQTRDERSEWRAPNPAWPAVGRRLGAHMFGKTKAFLSESKQELQKVNWPTRHELTDSTLLVVVVTALTALFIFVVDLCLSFLMRLIIR